MLCTQKQSSCWQSSQQTCADIRTVWVIRVRKLQLIEENEPGAPAMHTIIGYSYISSSSYTVLKIKPFVHIHSLQLGWTCVCDEYRVSRFSVSGQSAPSSCFDHFSPSQQSPMRSVNIFITWVKWSTYNTMTQAAMFSSPELLKPHIHFVFVFALNASHQSLL